MSAQPRHAFNSPPQLAEIPRCAVRLDEKESPDPAPTPAIWRPANTPVAPVSNRCVPQVSNLCNEPQEHRPMILNPRHEKYKAARLRGQDRAAAGKAAGYKWASAKVANVCGNQLDKRLNITVPASLSAKPARAALKRVGQAIQDKARAKPVGRVSRPDEARKPQSPGPALAPTETDDIRSVIAHLRAKRDAIDRTITVLEELTR